MQSESVGSSKSEITKLQLWRLGVKIGMAEADHKAFAAILGETSKLPEQGNQFPRELVNQVGLGVMHEVAAVKSFEEARSVAASIKLDLPETPKANANSATFIYRAGRLTRADFEALPPLVDSFRQSLEKANEAISDFLLPSGGVAAAVYRLAKRAAESRSGGGAESTASEAEQSGVPEALWSPFLDGLRRGAEAGEIQNLFNQMDKRVERFFQDDKSVS